MSEIRIVKGYIPGAIGRIAELHAVYYHRQWRFGLFFESKVAVELSEFMHRFREERDGIWIAMLDDRIQGAIAIDGIHGDSHGAHLRWFITSDAVRGRGVGNRLLETAVGFCRGRGYGKIYLWTFEGLDAARHLYQKTGFKLSKTQKGTQWGTEVVEQKFEFILEDRR